MSDTMQFLGSSQTFLGFLGALLVLCVIMNENNFIHTIIKKIQDDIKLELDKFDNEFLPEQFISERLEKIQKTPEYTALNLLADNQESTIEKIAQQIHDNQKAKPGQKIISREEIKSKIEDEVNNLCTKAKELIWNVKMNLSSLKADTPKSAENPAEALQNRLNNTSEQYIAPLYTLLFCFVVFLCDEAVSINPGAFDFVTSFLLLYTSISILFWVGLWLLFIKGVKKLGKEPTDPETIASSRDKLEGAIKMIGFSILVFLIVGMLVCLTGWFDGHIWLGQFVLYGIGIAVPVIFIGIQQSRSHAGFGDFHYRFMLKHFWFMLLYSALITSIIFTACHFWAQHSIYLFNYDPQSCLTKLLVFLFIIANGLFMPFWSQYFANTRIRNILIGKILRKHYDAKRDILDFENSIKKEASKINTIYWKTSI